MSGTPLRRCTSLRAGPPGSAARHRVSANPNPARVGTTVRFNARTTDAVHDRVDWDLDTVPGFEDADPADAARTPTRAEACTGPSTTGPSRVIAARVTDHAGRRGSSTGARRHAGEQAITSPPVASFSVRPNPAMSHEPVHFDGTGSRDPDGGPLIRWEWDVFPQPGVDIDRSRPSDVQTSLHRAPARRRPAAPPATSPTTTATPTTRRSATSSSTRLGPIRRRSRPDRHAEPGDVGQPITFDASGSTDADGSVVRYEWDLDGSTSSLSSAEYEVDTGATSSIVHSYSTPTHHEYRDPRRRARHRRRRARDHAPDPAARAPGPESRSRRGSLCRPRRAARPRGCSRGSTVCGW